MKLDYLAEMETIDGKCDRQGEQAWTTEQSPEKESPIMDAFDAADAQLVNGSPKRHDILRLKMNSKLGRLVLAEKCLNARIIEFRRVDVAQYLAVAVP